MKTQTKEAAMKSSTPQTQLPPPTQLHQAVVEGSLKFKLPGRFLLASLISVSLLASTSWAKQPTTDLRKWQVYTYHKDKGPTPKKAHALKDGTGIGFDFTGKPDRALLVTDDNSHRPDLLGDHTGETVSATIDISADDPDTTFVHYVNCDGDNGEDATVRFNLSTRSPMPIELGSCSSGGAVEHTTHWWSDPESIDLEYLLENGPAELSAPLDPSLWTDTCGHKGNYDAAHTAAFNQAVSNIDRIGLSFGGGCNFAFGAGSQPKGATFELHSFDVSP